MSLRRSVSWLGALALVLTGCAVSESAIDGTAEPATSTVTQRVGPIEARGVESCAKLPTTRAHSRPDGERLPKLVLPCLTDGPSVNLVRLGGRPVIVNLWASWCGPCRDEMPIMQDAYERYGEQVGFMGVNTKDDVRSAAAFLEDVGVTYPEVVDLDGRLLGHLRSPGLPVTVVLDSSGAVANLHVGPLTAKSLRDLVEPVLTGGIGTRQ